MTCLSRCASLIAMFWCQMARQMNRMNLYCRQEAVAVISGASRDKPFHENISTLSGTALDTFLTNLANQDLYCHSVDEVGYRPSECAVGSPSIPSGYGSDNAVLSCRDQRVNAPDRNNLSYHEISWQIPPKSLCGCLGFRECL